MEKLTLDKQLLKSIMTQSGAVLPDGKADAIATLLENHVAEAARAHYEPELARALDNNKELRNEAKENRILADEVMVLVTGKKREEFPEEGRTRLMREAAAASVAQMRESATKLSGMSDYEKTKQERDALMAEKAERVRGRYQKVKEALAKVLEDPQAKAKLGKRYKFPEKPEDETVEAMSRIVVQYDDDVQLGIPELSAQPVIEQEPAAGNPPVRDKVLDKQPEQLTEDDIRKMRGGRG
jgi:hypothetical protein